MTRNTDITLIGGGIIGLLTARELICAGARVTLLEKNSVGQESSWAGGGILLPLYPWRQDEAISRLVLRSFALYPALAEALIGQTGLDPEWTPCGLMIVKNPDISEALAWCRRFGVHYETQPPKFFADLNVQPLNPLWLPDIAQARNPRLIKALKQDIVRRGVEIRENCEPVAARLVNGKINTLETTQGNFSIESLIVCAGAWTVPVFTRLFPTLPALQIPNILPVKGQMLLFEADPATLRHMVLDDDRYLIPRRDGRILVGSSVEFGIYDKTLSSEVYQQLKSFALTILPKLTQFPQIGHWAGIRPGTHHGIPYIGRHSEIENLYLNAGHFRNGLAMGPASAELLADLILQRTPKVAPDSYQFTNPH